MTALIVLALLVVTLEMLAALRLPWRPAGWHITGALQSRAAHDYWQQTCLHSHLDPIDDVPPPRMWECVDCGVRGELDR